MTEKSSKRTYNIKSALPSTKPKSVVLPNGEKVELYYIATLAELLGRSSQTVRKWELSGRIPDSGFRDPFNRRLYTMEQMNMLVQALEKAMSEKGSTYYLATTNFTKYAFEGMKKIKLKYNGGK